MNKYLEKLAARVPKKLVQVAKDNPLLENTGHVVKQLEDKAPKLSRSAAIPDFRAMDRKQYNDLIKGIDERFKAEKAQKELARRQAAKPTKTGKPGRPKGTGLLGDPVPPPGGYTPFVSLFKHRRKKQ